MSVFFSALAALVFLITQRAAGTGGNKFWPSCQVGEYKGGDNFTRGDSFPGG